MLAVYSGLNFPGDYFVTYPASYVEPYLGVTAGEARLLRRFPLPPLAVRIFISSHCFSTAL